MKFNIKGTDHEHEVSCVILENKIVGTTDAQCGHTHTFTNEYKVTGENEIEFLDKNWICEFSEGNSGEDHIHDFEYPDEFKSKLGNWKSTVGGDNVQDAYAPDGTGSDPAADDIASSKRKVDEDGLTEPEDKTGSSDGSSEAGDNGEVVVIRNQKIFQIGEWNGSPWGDDEALAIVGNYNRFKNSFEPPLKCGHLSKHTESQGEISFGWARSLRYEKPFIVADFEVPKDVYQNYLKNKKLRFKSAEIVENFKRNGVEHGPTMIGVALLGASIPAVSDLGSVGIPYEDMKNNEVLQYTFESVKEEEMPENQVTAFEERIKKLEQENTIFRAKLRAKEIQEYTDKLIREGKLLPVEKPRVEELMRSLDSNKTLKFSETVKDQNGVEDTQETETDQLSIFKMFMDGLEKRVPLDEETAAASADENKADAPNEEDNKNVKKTFSRDITRAAETNCLKVEDQDMVEYAENLMKEDKELAFEDALVKASLAVGSDK